MRPPRKSITACEPILSASAALMIACGNSPIAEIQPNLTETDGNHEEAGDGGGGGSSIGDSSDPDPWYNGCLHFPTVGAWAYKHKCNGYASLNLTFEIENSIIYDGDYSYPWIITFGFGEDASWDKPNVMACCEPEDPELFQVDHPLHLRACYHDFVENGCISLIERLRSLKNDDGVPNLAKPQLDEIANWLAEHQQECRDQFWLASGASMFDPGAGDSALPEAFPDHIWQVPKETFYFKNIEAAVIAPTILGAYLPPDPEDWQTCESQKENNSILFIEAGPDPIFTFELVSGDGELIGPQLTGGQAAGSATFASVGTGCSVCSYLGFTSSGPKLDALVLDSYGTTEISRPTGSTILDTFRIALYSPVEATTVGSNTWRILAGTATFVISSMSGDDVGLLSVTNDSEIDIEIDGSTSEWVIHPFELHYTDALSLGWVISISELRFEG